MKLRAKEDELRRIVEQLDLDYIAILEQLEKIIEHGSENQYSSNDPKVKLVEREAFIQDFALDGKGDELLELISNHSSFFAVPNSDQENPKYLDYTKLALFFMLYKETEQTDTKVELFFNLIRDEPDAHDDNDFRVSHNNGNALHVVEDLNTFAIKFAAELIVSKHTNFLVSTRSAYRGFGGADTLDCCLCLAFRAGRR